MKISNIPYLQIAILCTIVACVRPVGAQIEDVLGAQNRLLMASNFWHFRDKTFNLKETRNHTRLSCM